MRQFETPEVLARLIVQNTVALPAAAFPVDAALEIGGLDEALWYTADWDLWLALARCGPTLWSPERAVAFRLHATSLTISGSRDLDDFASQLEAPLKRHQSALADHQRDGIVAQARASNLMNVWLASVFHNKRRSLLPVLRAIVTLGPRHWGVFLRNSRVIHRVLPRLRLMRRKVGSGA
jgi:hypothetical protein